MKAITGSHLQSPTPPGNFTWMGGPVLEHIVIAPVILNGFQWTSVVTDLYSQFVTSSHMEWLSEYNIPGYTIGYGSYREPIMMDPASLPVNATGYIKEEALKDIFLTMLKNGTIAPAKDLYIAFHYMDPIKVEPITKVDGFCGFHGSLDVTSLSLTYPYVTYGVNPDVSALSGCGSRPVDRITQTITHELFETITDPLVNTGAQDILGWYDNGPKPVGEIADICNGTPGQNFTFANGNTYVLEFEWSNKYQECIVVPPGASTNQQGATVGTPGGAFPGTAAAPTVTGAVTTYINTQGIFTQGASTPAPLPGSSTVPAMSGSTSAVVSATGTTTTSKSNDGVAVRSGAVLGAFGLLSAVVLALF